MKASFQLPALLAGVLAVTAAGEPGPLNVLKSNGGWCWFQDERALVAGDELVLGSLAGTDRAGSVRGDVEATAINLRTGLRRTFKLHPQLECDDHAAPALLALADGRLLATYQSHGRDTLMRWRRTLHPGDISAWSEEATLSVGAPVSYSNPFRLGAEGGRVHEFAHAGRRLYAGEDDYTGLGALDPQQPNQVFISTDAHPVTGVPLVSAADGLRHWEIFRGTSTAAGAAWD